MPLYLYVCEACKSPNEAFRSYDLRNRAVKCSECGGRAVYTIAAPMLGSERPSRDPAKRVIVSEKQVEAKHGKNWRDAGTTGREGGVGRKKIFT